MVWPELTRISQPLEEQPQLAARPQLEEQPQPVPPWPELALPWPELALRWPELVLRWPELALPSPRRVQWRPKPQPRLTMPWPLPAEPKRGPTPEPNPKTARERPWHQTLARPRRAPCLSPPMSATARSGQTRSLPTAPPRTGRGSVSREPHGHCARVVQRSPELLPLPRRDAGVRYAPLRCQLDAQIPSGAERHADAR